MSDQELMARALERLGGLGPVNEGRLCWRAAQTARVCKGGKSMLSLSRSKSVRQDIPDLR
jgi:hypothetical protein